jgi:hypothetical protein
MLHPLHADTPYVALPTFGERLFNRCLR